MYGYSFFFFFLLNRTVLKLFYYTYFLSCEMQLLNHWVALMPTSFSPHRVINYLSSHRTRDLRSHCFSLHSFVLLLNFLTFAHKPLKASCSALTTYQQLSPLTPLTLHFNNKLIHRLQIQRQTRFSKGQNTVKCK